MVKATKIWDENIDLDINSSDSEDLNLIIVKAAEAYFKGEYYKSLDLFASAQVLFPDEYLNVLDFAYELIHRDSKISLLDAYFRKFKGVAEGFSSILLLTPETTITNLNTTTLVVNLDELESNGDPAIINKIEQINSQIFDLIIVFDVIEYLNQPEEFIDKLKSISRNIIIVTYSNNNIHLLQTDKIKKVIKIANETKSGFIFENISQAFIINKLISGALEKAGTRINKAIKALEFLKPDYFRTSYFIESDLIEQQSRLINLSENSSDIAVEDINTNDEISLKFEIADFPNDETTLEPAEFDVNDLIETLQIGAVSEIQSIKDSLAKPIFELEIESQITEYEPNIDFLNAIVFDSPISGEENVDVMNVNESKNEIGNEHSVTEPDIDLLNAIAFDLPISDEENVNVMNENISNTVIDNEMEINSNEEIITTGSSIIPNSVADLRAFKRNFKANVEDNSGKNIEAVDKGDVNNEFDIDANSRFLQEITAIVKAHDLKILIEAGTQIGLKSTKAIALSLKENGTDGAKFIVIEANSNIYASAISNLADSGLIDKVKLINSLSVPRNLLNNSSSNIISHNADNEYNKIKEYYLDSHLDASSDDALGKLISEFRGKPDFVLLNEESLGAVEFNYLISILKNDCIIALTGINSTKHAMSYEIIKSDSRFEILYKSRDKNGSCIAKFSTFHKKEIGKTRRIIIHKPDSLSDNIIATGMLEHIKAKYPEASIAVFCQAEAAELYKYSPFVDDIISFYMDKALTDNVYRKDLIIKLQNFRPDLLLYTSFSRDAIGDFFALNSGADEIVAFEGDNSQIDEALRLENNKKFTKLVKSEYGARLEISRLHDFLNALEIDASISPKIWTSEIQEDFARAFYHDNELDPAKTIIIFPGNINDLRFYNNYGSALTRICEEFDYSIVALGTKEDYEVNARILEQIACKSFNLSGLTSVLESAAIISKAGLCVGADSGFAHIASALGVKNVIVLGGGKFGIFSPNSNLTTALCTPRECYNCNWNCEYESPFCITELIPEALELAIRKAITTSDSERPTLIVQKQSISQLGFARPIYKEFSNDFHPEVLNNCNIEIFEHDANANPDDYWESPDSDFNKIKVSCAIYISEATNLLKLRLENLFNQTLYVQGQLEIIIVDSSDGEINRNIILDIFQAKPNIKYIRGNKNESYPKNINKAILNAKGAYFIKAELDNLFFNKSLEILASELDSETNSDCVYGDFYYSDDNDISVENFEEKSPLSLPEFDAALLFYYQITGPAPMIRISAFVKAGLYAEEFKVFAERELFFRFTSKGIKSKKINGMIGVCSNYRNFLVKELKDPGPSELDKIRDFNLRPKKLLKLLGFDNYVNDRLLSDIYFYIGSLGKEFRKISEESESDFKFAMRCFIMALEVDNTNVKAINNLSILLSYTNEKAQAETALRSSVSVAPPELVELLQVNLFALQENRINAMTWIRIADISETKVNLSNLNPVISVITPTLGDRPGYLKKAIKSVLNQTFENFELIVVNDGGHNLADFIDSFDDKRIKFIHCDKNQGRSAARNTAINAAKGEYIAYLDDDDTFYPKHLQTLLDAITAAEDKLVFSEAARSYQRLENFKYVEYFKDFPFTGEYSKDRLLSGNFIPILSILHTKSLVEIAGGFNEELETHEDYDLLLRFSRFTDFKKVSQITCEFSWRVDRTSTTSAMKVQMLKDLEYIYSQTFIDIVHKPEIQLERTNFIEGLKANINFEQLNSIIKEKPGVSIIIPVYNKAELTSKCLESIIKETSDSYNYEIIVIDNNSQDATSQIVSDFINKYPAISYVRNSSNLGFSKACNIGIANSRFDYKLLLNNDIIVLPGWLENLMQAAEVNPGAGILGSLLFYPDGETIQHSGVTVGLYGGFITAFHNDKLRKISKAQDANVSKFMPAVTGACMLIKQEVINAIGVLDEAYVNGFEDVDYCFKATRAGFGVYYCADSRLIHFESMSQGRHDKDKENALRLNSKWFGKINIHEDGDKTKKDLAKLWMREEFQQYPNSKELIVRNIRILNQINEFDAAEEWARLLEAIEIKDEEIDISVSFIIPVLNNKAYTVQCVDSIYSTCKTIEYEIIFIDNGSDDGTRDFLENEKRRNYRIKTIFNVTAKTYAEANNQGAKIAQGKYLFFLNNDIKLFNDAIANTLELFEQDDTIGIQGAKLLYPNDMVQHAGIVWGAVSDELELHYHLYLCFPRSHESVNKTREFQFVTGAYLAIPKNVFDETGGFDPNYVFGFEDLDLCLAAKQKGYKVIYNHKAEAYHFESITKRSEGLEKFERFTVNPDSVDAQNYKYFIEKWNNHLVNDADKYYTEDGVLSQISDNKLRTAFNNRIKAVAGGIAKAELEGDSDLMAKTLTTLYGIKELTDSNSANWNTIQIIESNLKAAESVLGIKPVPKKVERKKKINEDQIDLFGFYSEEAKVEDTDDTDEGEIELSTELVGKIEEYFNFGDDLGKLSATGAAFDTHELNASAQLRQEIFKDENEILNSVLEIEQDKILQEKDIDTPKEDTLKSENIIIESQTIETTEPETESLDIDFIEIPSEPETHEIIEISEIIEEIKPVEIKPKKILFTMFGWNESGGGTTFPKAVAKRYAQKGNDVSVFYAGALSELSSEPYKLIKDSDEGVALFGVFNRPSTFLDAANPEREINDAKIVELFSKVLDEVEPDVVHFHNFLGLSFAIAKEVKRRKIPCVYTPHNYHLIDPTLYMYRSDLSIWNSTNIFENSELIQRYPALQNSYSKRIDAAKELLNENIDYTLAVSKAVGNSLIDFGANRYKVSVVHQAHQTVDNILRQSRGARELQSIPTFGFIGAVMPHKGVHVPVQAMQLIQPGTAKLNVYGFAIAQYLDMMKGMDRTKAVNFLGEYREDDLRYISKEIDAMIVPSLWADCAPLVVLEAFAMGVPVIGSRIGGIPDFIKDGVNGKLYTYNSSSELAEIIRYLAYDKNELSKLQAGVTVPYGFETYVDHILGIYERLVNGDRPSADEFNKFMFE